MSTQDAGLLKCAQWRLECWAFLIAERLACLLPMPVLWNLGAALAGLRWLMPGRCRAVRENLRVVEGPDTSPERLDALTRDVFRHTAGNLLCSLKTAHLSLDELKRISTVEGEEIMKQALARNRGVFVVLAHMGNWELLAQLGDLLVSGVPGGTFYRPLNNPYLDRIIVERRTRMGIRLFAKRSALSEPITLLREGGAVSVLSDQRAGDLGTLCPFFGRLMSMNPLPALLHKRTQCEVVGLSLRTTAPGRWTFRWHATETDPERGFTAAHMTRLLETMIRESVADEFWMQNLWSFNERKPLRIRGKRGPLILKEDRDADPLEQITVLVRVPDDEEEAREVFPAVERLATFRPDFRVTLLGRDPTPWSALPAPFLSIENSPALPEARCVIVLTSDERAARAIAHRFEGPVYSLPDVAQGAHRHWITIKLKEHHLEQGKWIGLLERLGMNVPPLVPSYV